MDLFTATAVEQSTHVLTLTQRELDEKNKKYTELKQWANPARKAPVRSAWCELREERAVTE